MSISRSARNSDDQTRRITVLQSILDQDYSQELSLDDVSAISEWLIQFYASLIRLSAQHRNAAPEADRQTIKTLGQFTDK